MDASVSWGPEVWDSGWIQGRVLDPRRGPWVQDMGLRFESWAMDPRRGSWVHDVGLGTRDND